MVLRFRSYLWPGLFFSYGLVTIAAVFFDWPNPLRGLLLFIFLLFFPGGAFFRFFPKNQPSATVVLAIALSLAFDTLAAQLLLYAGQWSPRFILLILVGIGWLGAFTQLPVRIHLTEAAGPLRRRWFTPESLRNYQAQIVRGWWVILLSGLVSINMALIYSYYIATPQYDAVAQLAFNPAELGQQSDLPAALSAYSAAINSQAVAQTAGQFLQIQPEEYAKYTTSVTSGADSAGLQVHVRGPNPQIAGMLANGLSQSAIISLQNLYASPRLVVFTRAAVPVQFVSPRIAQNAVFAALVGFLLGLGLVAFSQRIAFQF